MKKKNKKLKGNYKKKGQAGLTFISFLSSPFLSISVWNDNKKNNVNFNFLYEVYEISWYYLNNKKINELKFIKIKIENIFFSKINMIKYKRVSFSKNPIKSYRS